MRGKRLDASVADLNLLPVMNLMAVLIPFLLMAAQFVSLSVVDAAIPAEPYTAARLAALRAEGKPVFVNLTAAWCVSCLYNERVALSSNITAEAFKASGTIYLIGDWTNRNPEISALLKQHGREGVPLYLYYAPGASEPRILPQILNESLMLEVLGVSR